MVVILLYCGNIFTSILEYRYREFYSAILDVLAVPSDAQDNPSYLFLDCSVLLCAFHREQAWDRKLTEKETGLEPALKQEVKVKLRAIAEAR